MDEKTVKKGQKLLNEIESTSELITKIKPRFYNTLILKKVTSISHLESEWKTTIEIPETLKDKFVTLLEEHKKSLEEELNSL